MGRAVTRLWRGLALASITVAIGVSIGRSVEAHSFLTRTSPEAGARLTVAPSEIVLDFSEPLVGSPIVTVSTLDGDTVGVSVVGLVGDGSVVRAALDPVGNDVYRVAWRVTAVDGHTAEGEFAFAVGTDLPAGVLAAGGADTGPAWAQAAAAWLLMGGLAVALGGLATEQLVWRRAVPVTAWVTVPSVVAAVGALLTLALRLDERGRLARPGDWSDGFAGRSDGLLLLATVALALAAFLATQVRVRRAALGWLVLAVVAVVLAGHAANAEQWWVQPLTTLHVLAAGLWVGALVHLNRATRAVVEVAEPTRRYSRAAAIAVAVAVPLGVAAAASLVDSPRRILATSYGRALTVKVALVAVAIALAVVARRRAASGTGPRSTGFRRLRPHPRGLNHVNLVVADVGRARAFYEAALGYEFVKEETGITFLTTPGTSDSLALQQSGGDLDRISGKVRSPGEMGGVDHIGFAVGSGTIDDLVAAVESAGGSVLMRTTESGDATVFVTDLDGCVLQLG